MKNFTVCWYPDFPDRTLAGELTGIHKDFKTAVDYIGPLSRFTRSQSREKVYDVVAVFSGPEPQRTILENIVMPQLKNSGLKYFVVRGLPSAHRKLAEEHTIDFLTSNKLQQLLESGEVVLARSGYSTIMDLAALSKKAIFIPTPGQTEQQYLAKRLMDMGVVYCVQQDSFDLSVAMQEAARLPGLNGYRSDNSLFNNALDRIIKLKQDSSQKISLTGKINV
jgi:uncharacterized protein (TIGR00661 family)